LPLEPALRETSEEETFSPPAPTNLAASLASFWFWLERGEPFPAPFPRTSEEPPPPSSLAAHFAAAKKAFNVDFHAAYPDDDVGD